MWNFEGAWKQKKKATQEVSVAHEPESTRPEWVIVVLFGGTFTLVV